MRAACEPTRTTSHFSLFHSSRTDITRFSHSCKQRNATIFLFTLTQPLRVTKHARSEFIQTRRGLAGARDRTRDQRDGIRASPSSRPKLWSPREGVMEGSAPGKSSRYTGIATFWVVMMTMMFSYRIPAPCPGFLSPAVGGTRGRGVPASQPARLPVCQPCRLVVVTSWWWWSSSSSSATAAAPRHPARRRRGAAAPGQTHLCRGRPL